MEKQGLGVDRMYREMVVLGHRPPVIAEEAGPRVRVRLVGGDPVVPVVTLAGRIEPTVRRRDVRVALIVDSLLREPFVTPERAASVLQRTPAEAAEVLDVAADCRVDGHPLIVQFKDVWTLSPSALALLAVDGSGSRRTSDLLPYRRPDTALVVAREWLAIHDRITTGDHAALTGLTKQGALGQLERLVSEDYLMRQLKVYAAWVDEADRRAAARMADIMPRPVIVRQASGEYEKIAASLRDTIQAGRLKPGDQLPTVAELAAAHTVAVGTAHRALALLKRSISSRSRVDAAPP